MGAGTIPASSNRLFDNNRNLGSVIMVDTFQILMFFCQPNRKLAVLIGNAPSLKLPLDFVLHDLVFVRNLNDHQRINLCASLEKFAVQLPLLVQ